MKHLVVAIVVMFGAACAMFAEDPSMKLAPGEKMREQGEACTRDAQCYTLWCVNRECTLRDP
jgi:hypothetical protein